MTVPGIHQTFAVRAHPVHRRDITQVFDGPRRQQTVPVASADARFDERGWPYFIREVYDSFYPGYGEGWPMLTGAIGMLFESASSSGGAVVRNDGTLRTLKQAAWEHYSAEWATVRTSAACASLVALSN